MTFDKHDLLRQGGYGEGNFIPLMDFADGGSSTTTSDTYGTGYQETRVEPMFAWNDVAPSGATLQVLLTFRTGSLNGDQVDVRVENRDDTPTTVIERTGVTTDGAQITEGPTTYEPDDRDVVSRYRIQFKNSDNATSVELQQGSVIFGVQI